MQAFNRARNFVLQGCYFIDNTGGRRSTLDEVLVKLKDETASGVSYDSIDHTPNPSAVLDAELASAIISTTTSNDPVYFIHSTSPSDARAYGESAVKSCNGKVLVASVFLHRFLLVFPAEAKRRLVPTLAYQLAISPYAPEELKIEILGALFLEPDIPERTLANQFEKLIIRPLQNVAGLLKTNPVVFVLDSVHNVDYDTVGVVVRDLARAVDSLRRSGINAKAVITGVGYQRIISAFTSIQTTTTIYQAPITNPFSLLSIARSTSFRFLNWKYSRSEFVQRAVEIASVLGIFVSLPPLISVVGMTILPSPLGVIVGGFALIAMPVIISTGITVGITVLAYRAMARWIWPRSI